MIDELNKSLKNNEKRRSYLNENRVKMILKLMQSNSVDELVKEGVISKRTKYNYLNKTIKIGIDKNVILDVEIQACTYLKLYFNYLVKGN